MNDSGRVIASVAPAELRGQPDVAQVQSFYTTHNPAMVSRDRRSTYVVAYFKPLSDKVLKNVAQQIENRFAGQSGVKLGGGARGADRRVDHPRAARPGADAPGRPG
jgi:hypothetical protein